MIEFDRNHLDYYEPLFTLGKHLYIHSQAVVEVLSCVHSAHYLTVVGKEVCHSKTTLVSSFPQTLTTPHNLNLQGSGSQKMGIRSEFPRKQHTCS